MEQHSLEHGLAQKLMIMENAAARIATLRAQLRANVDQARKEVRAVMSQQMLLIRAREQELLDELDVIMNHKDGKLELQQQSLYKSICMLLVFISLRFGECKQALEKVRDGGSSTSGAVDVLTRIGHVELSSRETAHVSFESDAIELRSKLLSFGAIRTSSRHDDANKSTPGESLPMEMEEYDDALMAHKSVLRMKSNPSTSSNMSRQQVESVRKWLKKIPSGPGALDADVSTIMAEFDVIKNSTPEAEEESSDSASSFDIVAQDSSAQLASAVGAEKVLSAEFLNTLQQPLSTWLMRIMPSEPSKPEHAKDDLSASEQECEIQGGSTFNEGEFVSHLSKLFLCNSTTASHGSSCDKLAASGVDLTTILGWKQVLDKIEQSAPYWLRDKKC
ncbi:hypothetical protein OESDEN_00671 [Oesophagostomum dentatum]|uniref:Uncharacterized protein n=1 Tax=Oesophagostomum dentatum TaxID=61180 RepID=A0A0B1TV52_OESDE|nr:hypothetical protein OESDEN_00671 [Oesophagostomum dentatum]